MSLVFNTERVLSSETVMLSWHFEIVIYYKKELFRERGGATSNYGNLSKKIYINM